MLLHDLFKSSLYMTHQDPLFTVKEHQPDNDKRVHEPPRSTLTRLKELRIISTFLSCVPFSSSPFLLRAHTAYLISYLHNLLSFHFVSDLIQDRFRQDGIYRARTFRRFPFGVFTRWPVPLVQDDQDERRECSS